MQEIKIFEGNLMAEGLRFGIIAARFNEFISSKLVGGTIDAIKRHGGAAKDITLAWFPDAYEIHLAAQKMAAGKKYDAIICLGAVIRGIMSHFDYVCAEVSKDVVNLGLNSGVPVIFGVLTTESIEQAVERAGTKSGNKGVDAAVAAIEMANLLQKLEAI